MNWMECLARPNWNLCSSFPELCISHEAFYHGENHHDGHDNYPPVEDIKSAADML